MLVHVAFRDRRVTNVEVPNHRRTRSVELINDWAEERTVTRSRAPKNACSVVLGCQPTPFCYCPLSRVTKHVGTNSEPVFPSTPSDVFRNISLSLTTGREKMAFYKFCRKKYIYWHWLVPEDHAKLVKKITV